MRKILSKSAIFIFCITLVSCSDIFEESLEDKKVNILSPEENKESTIYTINFKWDPLEAATSYNLQIVTPSFAAQQNILLDVTIPATSLAFTLDPGKYEWRIKAKNGSSSTEYITRSIEIFSSTLASQTMTLVNPAASNLKDIYLAGSSVNFEWRKLYGTDKYWLQVDTITGDFTGIFKVDKLVSSISSLNFFAFDGKYKWHVKAQNLPDETQWSDERAFILDNRAPVKVLNLSPAASISLTRPLQLIWRASPELDVVKYRLYVYTVDKVRTTDTIPMALFPKEVFGRTTNTFNFDQSYGLVGDKVVWRVKAVDYAGNESPFSNYGYFINGN
jgi:hypothetical protein